jgi:type II secretory pathway pseudopilin PulG
VTKTLPIRYGKPSEEGYTLVFVIFLIALMTISMSVALPKISKKIQRDREVETMQRGKQYIRAVKLYRKKFGAYPPSVDVLVTGTNNIRFLRKKYADPTTGQADWKPVFFGQNKAPLAMGFFGVPLGGPAIAGNGPGGSTSGMQTAASLASQSSGTDPNASADPNNPNAATSGTSGSTSAFGQTGQTYGGAGIIGFSPNSPKQSIMIYKTMTHYNEWEFVYFPMIDQMMQPDANPVGGVPLQPGSPGFSGSSSATPAPNIPSTPAATQ